MKAVQSFPQHWNRSNGDRPAGALISRNPPGPEVVASVARDHFGASGTMVMALINIGFGPKSGAARLRLDFAVLKGSGYGNPVGMISPPNTEPVSLVVDQKPISTPAGAAPSEVR